MIIEVGEAAEEDDPLLRLQCSVDGDLKRIAEADDELPLLGAVVWASEMMKPSLDFCFIGRGIICLLS